MGAFNKQKAFGQHFLKDADVINRIVDRALQASLSHPKAAILEIGPGRGAITRPLLERLPLEIPFHLAERDRDLIEYWSGESRVGSFLKGDFLDQSAETLGGLGSFVVVSNLPYSAGTAIVVRLAKLAAQIPEMILMFQSEVAKRLYSGPSTPDRGSLSLFIQNQWEIEKLCEVPPHAFQPPPKVMSEVVVLKRRVKPFISFETPGDELRWDGLLRSAFKHRRKMIKGNFASTPWQHALEKSGVDPTKRAESLDWQEWVRIWDSGKENS